MEFQNNQLSNIELPSFNEVTFTPLHEHFVKLRLAVVSVIYFIFLLVAVGVVAVVSYFVPGTTTFLMHPIVLTSILASLLSMGLLAWFIFASTKAIHYAIRDHDIIVQSGVFWKQEVIQPLKRVQHVEVTRGPLDKRFGLANVKLFSAGTSLSTFRIPGIDFDLAEQIRQYVLDYQEASSAAMNQP